VKNKIFLVFFSILALTSCSEQSPPSISTPNFKWINDPPIKVLINGQTICVPSQFLNPEYLSTEGVIKSKDGSIKSISFNRDTDIEFTALLPELNGYTKDFIKKQFINGKTWQNSKAVLVNIRLLNNISDHNYRTANHFLTFEEETTVDKLGFSTKKSTKKSCYAAYTASPTIALEPPGDCAFRELKFANSKLPKLVLNCSESLGTISCKSVSYLNVNNIGYAYSFDKTQLQNLVAINKKVEDRVKKWLADDSCKKIE
jgi:hypothetical protein